MESFLKFFTMIALFMTLSSQGCDDKNAKQNAEDVAGNQQIEKNKGKRFSSKWSEVQKLQEKGLIKSADSLVELIYQKAVTDKNHAEQLRCMSAQVEFAGELNEDAWPAQFAVINKYEARAAYPMKNIVRVEKAKFLAQSNTWYYRNHSANDEEKDPRLWNIAKRNAEVNKIFDLALNDNKETMINTPISNYALVFDMKETVVQQITPTLYHYMIQAFLTFMNENSYDYQTLLSEKSDWLLLDAASFLNADLSTIKKEDENAKIILKSFQDIQKVNKKKGFDFSTDWFTVKRFAFMMRDFQDQSLEQKYWSNLQEIAQKTTFKPIRLEIQRMELEKDYYALNEKINTGKLTQPKEEIEALLKRVQTHKKETALFPYLKNGQWIENEIKAKTLEIHLETINAANKPFLMNWVVKNLSQVKYTIYEVNFDVNTFEQKRGKVVVSKVVDIPFKEDYQPFSTELMIDALPKGHYELVTDNEEQNSYNHLYFYSTDIFLSSLEHHLYLNDFTTGEPKADYAVSLMSKRWNSEKNAYVMSDKVDVKTDAQGQIRKTDLDYNAYALIDNMYFLLSGMGYYRNSISDGKQTTVGDLLTDRAVYRPGQRVYYKGIVKVFESPSKGNVVAGEKVKVELYDSNYKLIKTQEGTTNAFGSVEGFFDLPSSGLNGNFTLKLHGKELLTNSFIQVMEYKRPKLLIEWSKADKAYTMKEENSVKGILKTYTGIPVANQEMTFSVNENQLWFPRRGYSFNENKLWNGTVKTDSKGVFEIILPAQATDEINQKRYAINVSAIDAAGESVTSFTSVNISKFEFDIQIQTDAFWKKESADFTVETNASNGAKIAAKGEYIIYKIERTPVNPFQRSWAAPKQTLVSETDFKANFDYLDYQWKEGKVDSIVLTKGQWTAFQAINISTLNWKDGEYVLVAKAKDKNGFEVEGNTIFRVQKELAALSSEQVLFIQKKNNPILGKEMEIELFSKVKDGVAMVSFYDGTKDLGSQRVAIENGKGALSFALPSVLKQMLEIRVTMIRFGKIFTASDSFIPASEIPNMEVEWMSFRDKIKPNQKEEWRLKVKGEDGKPVAAEVLLSMYDASLDQFAKNAFHWNTLGYGYYLGQRNPMFNTSSTYANFTKNNVEKERAVDLFELQTHFLYGLYGTSNYAIKSKMHVKSGEMSISAKGSRTSVRYEMMDAAPAQQTAVLEELAFVEEETVSVKEQGNVRENLQELAFFLPTLTTDANGEVKVVFNAPQALTTWRVLGLAYSKDLGAVSFEKETMTQKELMVEITAPRFVREGDVVYMTARVSNTTEKTLTTQVDLELFDLMTNKSINSEFALNKNGQEIQLNAGASQIVEWKINVPYTYTNVGVRVMANAQKITDGEQVLIPVLSNKTMVTNALPFTLGKAGDHVIDYSSILPKSDVAQLMVTLDYVQNPLWHVLMAMPNVIDKNDQQTLQLSNQLVVFAALDKILEHNPAIIKVLETWKARGASALMSELENNAELKQIMLQETPWVLQAQSQADRKMYLANLLLAVDAKQQAKDNWNKLVDGLTFEDKGWPWCFGMPSNAYISKQILKNIQRMQQLNPVFAKEIVDNKVIENVMHYVLTVEQSRFEKIKDNAVAAQFDDLDLYLLTLQVKGDWSKYDKMIKVLEVNATKDWAKRSIHAQMIVGKIATLKNQTALNKEINTSVKQRAITTADRGTFWPNGMTQQGVQYGDVYTQAMIIDYLSKDDQAKTLVQNAQLWLLLNKRSNDWGNNYATTEAIFGLTMSTDWSTASITDAFKQNGKVLSIDKMELGSGYLNISLDRPFMPLTIQKKNANPSFGTVFTSYLIDIDKVETHETGLKISKIVYRMEPSKDGKGDFVKVKIDANTKLKQGERLFVELKLEADREMEYLQIKDYRAAGLEPVDQASGYQYSGGVGSYKDVKDASVQFSIGHVQRGVYLLNYELVVARKGNFSNGYVMVQSAFNPEMVAYGLGSRITVE